MMDATNTYLGKKYGSPLATRPQAWSSSCSWSWRLWSTPPQPLKIIEENIGKYCRTFGEKVICYLRHPGGAVVPTVT